MADGLGGAVFTTDANRAYTIGRRIRTGSFGHNGLPIDIVDAPFGGFEQSGIGREGGAEGFSGFVEFKTIYIMPEIPSALRTSNDRK